MECLAETYADIMPSAFAEGHRQAIPRRTEETRRWWDTVRGPDVAQAWVARDLLGEVVGVARSGPGPQSWEVDLGAPAIAVLLELHHIYTRRRTHGSGLGQSLLDVAVADQDAYLWILNGNSRAERFYRRNAFVPDGAEMSCGPSWFHRPMFRMVREAAPSRRQGTSAGVLPAHP